MALPADVGNAFWLSLDEADEAEDVDDNDDGDRVVVDAFAVAIANKAAADGDNFDDEVMIVEEEEVVHDKLVEDEAAAAVPDDTTHEVEGGERVDEEGDAFEGGGDGIDPGVGDDASPSIGMPLVRMRNAFVTPQLDTAAVADVVDFLLLDLRNEFGFASLADKFIGKPYCCLV